LACIDLHSHRCGPMMGLAAWIPDSERGAGLGGGDDGGQDVCGAANRVRLCRMNAVRVSTRLGYRLGGAAGR
jgi:hypothetical protein